jgi:hypothetical protein
MRLVFRLVAVAALLMFLLMSLGMSSPSWAKDLKPFPQTAEVNKPMEKVFASLRDYFSGGASNSDFQLVKADEKTGILVAKRSGIDQRSWGAWAYCKVSTMNLLDTLEDGAVTVKVKLESDGMKKTHVSVISDFEGAYTPVAGGEPIKVKCQSQGILEKEILAAAGASAEEID